MEGTLCTYRFTGELENCSKNVPVCTYMQSTGVMQSYAHMHYTGCKIKSVCSKIVQNKMLTVLVFYIADWIPAAFLIHDEPF
eukprot:14797177-Ditylum_brightwellii.AAC.1